MGKIKSAIITTLLALILVTGAIFGAVTFGANNVKSLNSVLSMIPLGSEFTGKAEETLYPEGILTAEEFNQRAAADSDFAEKYFAHNGYYFEKEEYDEDDADQVWLDTCAKVKADAQVMADRFADRRLTSFSISVVNEIGIHIAIPTTFSYAQYKHHVTHNFANDPTRILDATFALLTTSGEVSVRHTSLGINNDPYETGYNSLVSRKVEVSSLFKGVTRIARGQTYAIRFDLTEAGKEWIKDVSASVADNDDKKLYIYIGKTQALSIPVESAITEKTFYISVGNDTFADQQVLSQVALLNSVFANKFVSLSYNSGSLAYTTSENGVNVALFTAIALCALLLTVCVCFVCKYKKLGLVASLMAILFAEIVMYVVYLMGIVVTFATIVAMLIGFVLFVGCTVFTFENVRRQTSTGRTMPASIKAGYKDVLSTMIDLHVVLLVFALFATLVAVGELSTCGVVLMIASLASYALHWFTRLMWYVMSSPVKDKFKFCSFKRVVYEDD